MDESAAYQQPDHTNHMLTLLPHGKLLAAVNACGATAQMIS